VKYRVAAFAVGLLPLLASTSGAGGPVVLEVSGGDAFALGTLESLSLQADGVLRPGPSFDAVALDAPTAWAAIADKTGLWIGTGNEAALLRVSKDGKVERHQPGEGLMVAALAPLPGGHVAAAVFPGGRIVDVAPDGTKKDLATIPAEHVWGMLADAKGALTVATGLPGAVFAVDPAGQVTKVADVGDEHARCVARSGKEILVGTSPKGRVLALDGAKVRVLRDLEPQEVVGLVPLADGGLLIAANADQAGGNAQALAGMLKPLVAPQPSKPDQPPAPRPALQDGAVFHLEASGVLTTLWEAKKVAVLGLAADGAGAVAGTYPSGRLYRVEPGQPSSLWADLPEAEASVLVAGDRGLLAVVTSNPAVLHRPDGSAAKGTWASAPLDAGLTARWGRLTVTGKGVKTVAWRGGETSEPDETWSPWKPVDGYDGASGGLGATTRFLQVRAEVEGQGAELRSVSVVTEAPNRSPSLSGLTVTKAGAPKAGPSTPQAGAAREIAWKAEDADGDALLTSVHANRDGSPLWFELVAEAPLDKTATSWDTTGIPDGTYRVRVTVSDAPGNAATAARTATQVFGPFRVDNTAPLVKAEARIEGGRLAVGGEATDQAGGRIHSARASVDGGPWRPLVAKDGIFDSPTERFEASLPAPAPGPHDVVVQAMDGDGNVAAAATVVAVK
jgi:hypothetical protein